MHALLNLPFAFILLPLAAAFLFAGALRLAGGPGLGARLADAGVGLAFLLAFILFVAGLHGFPFIGQAAHRSTADVALAGLVIGVVLTLLGSGTAIERIAAILAPIALLLWLHGTGLWHLPWHRLLPLAALGLGGILMLLRLQAAGTRGSAPIVLLLAVALGLAGVAALSGIGGISRLAIMLAASLGGFLLWNWPVAHWRLGPAGTLAAGGAALALAAALLQIGTWMLIPLALVLLAVFVEPAADRLLRGGYGAGLGRALAPLLLALIAALPVLAALAATALIMARH